MSTPAPWMENASWWVYGVHPAMAGAYARFHARNRFHLRLAMSQSSELEAPSFWASELERRQAAMLAGQAVHLVGVPKGGDSSPSFTADGPEIGALVSFWGIEHGDFEACTLSILLDRYLEGRGLMYALTAPAIQEVMARYHLHRVMATHLPENLRSARLLRRLGFAVEGYARDFLRINGRWRDAVLLSLLGP